jgi:hypothetical protein
MTARLVCVGAIVLAIAGVFGNWRSAGGISLDGFEGPHNGWMVIVFALIALAGVGAMMRGSLLGAIAVVGGAAVMVFAGVQNLVDDGDVLGGHSGWGIWVTIASSAILAGAGVAAAIGSRRAGPRTSP